MWTYPMYQLPLPLPLADEGTGDTQRSIEGQRCAQSYKAFAIKRDTRTATCYLSAYI